MPSNFNVRKAAQVTAFLVKAQGGVGNHMKTVKLLYMADRKYMEIYDLTILDDDFVSMEHGPVDSTVYDYIKGKGADRKTWNQYITDRNGNEVRLSRELSDSDFDELSKAEKKVLSNVAEEFRSFRPFQLVDYIHQNCKEWEDPGKTSIPLSYKRIFSAIGKKNSDELAARIDEFRELDKSLSRAG